MDTEAARTLMRLLCATQAGDADLARAASVVAAAMKHEGEGEAIPRFAVEGYRAAARAGRVDEMSDLFERVLLPHAVEFGVCGYIALRGALLGAVARAGAAGYTGTAFVAPMVLSADDDAVALMAAEVRVTAAVLGGFPVGHDARVHVIDLGSEHFVLAPDLRELVTAHAELPGRIERLIHALLFQRTIDTGALRVLVEAAAAPLVAA